MYDYEYEWKILIQDMIDAIDIGISGKEDKELTLGFLADKLGYSVFHTTKKFKELSGVAFRDYLRLRKLAFAVADLRNARSTEKTILDIAVDYGFSSHEAFTRAFNNAYGVTPSEYKNNPTPIELRKKIYISDRYLSIIGGKIMKKALFGTPKFNCSNFERFVRRNLDKPQGEITSEDMAGLKWLDINDNISEISDITGIEYAVNLTNLTINDWHPINGCAINHSISDISPLSGLTDLSILRLAGVKVNNISPIRHLVNLTEIYLELTNDKGDMTDISPLVNLTKLRTLNIGKIRSSDMSLLTNFADIKELGLTISDIKADDMRLLANLPKLERLWLYGNQIDDISFLSGLTNLKQLNLSDNKISDISVLSGLVNLEWLSLANNQVHDVSPLRELRKLKNLELNGNPIKDFSPVAHLIKTAAKALPGVPIFKDSNFEQLVRNSLRKPEGDITSEDMAKITMLGSYEGTLDIPITDISGIEYAVNLEILFLLNCQISDISGLSRLTNLKKIHLFGNENGNKFGDINSLGGLIKLDELILYRSGISDISAISELINLSVLQLNANPINNLAPLSGLLNLQNLSLDSELICDISPLGDLVNLKKLDLNCKLLTDINPLKSLVNLEALSICSDVLTDINAVSQLVKLEKLSLNGSPVSDYTPAAHVRDLQK